MKRSIFLLLFTLTMLFSISTVTMGVGVFGSTDLMITPTTATLDPNNMGVAINFAEGDFSYFNFDFGLARDLEMGLAVFNNPYTDDTTLSIRGKYQLLHESSEYPGLAIGVQDLGEDDASPYLVVSKRIPDIGVTGYLGAGGGMFDGIFGGLNKTFNMSGGSAMKRLDLFLEADSYGLNIGTKLGIGSQTKINFGLVDMENWILGATFQF